MNTSSSGTNFATLFATSISVRSRGQKSRFHSSLRIPLHHDDEKRYFRVPIAILFASPTSVRFRGKNLVSIFQVLIAVQYDDQ